MKLKDILVEEVRREEFDKNMSDIVSRLLGKDYLDKVKNNPENRNTETLKKKALEVLHKFAK